MMDVGYWLRATLDDRAEAGFREQVSSMKEGFLRRRLIHPVLHLLKQGITPEKIALSLALGVTLGVFPVIGATTALCALAAFVLRLNLSIIQLVNYFVYPLQLALLVPFLHAGSHLFGGTAPGFSLSEVFELIHVDTWQAISTLWAATLRAILLWLLAGPFAVAAIYFGTLPALRRLARVVAPAKSTDGAQTP